MGIQKHLTITDVSELTYSRKFKLISFMQSAVKCGKVRISRSKKCQPLMDELKKVTWEESLKSPLILLLALNVWNVFHDKEGDLTGGKDYYVTGVTRDSVFGVVKKLTLEDLDEK